MANDPELRHQELARILLQKAQQDLDGTQVLGDSQKIADELVGFHAQQTIEKAIKAALTRRGIAFEYTHDLLTLFEQIEKARLEPPTTAADVEVLTPFAVQFRYSVLNDVEPFNRQKAIQLAGGG